MRDADGRKTRETELELVDCGPTCYSVGGEVNVVEGRRELWLEAMLWEVAGVHTGYSVAFNVQGAEVR